MSRFGFIVMLLYCTFLDVNASFWPKLGAFMDSSCALQNTKLLSLLSLLCNTTQTQSVQMRDACYGCFYRACGVLDGPTQLYSINDCSRLYIQQTIYSSCADNLQAIVDGNRYIPDTASSSYCYSGYCDFVRCIRRINTQQLISSCYNNSRGIGVMATDTDRVYFYTNVTACILARTRCSQFNPITGELQNHFVKVAPGAPGQSSPVGPVAVSSGPSTMPSPFLNALHISDTGDIRVLSFPLTTLSPAVSENFCTNGPGPLQQAGFGPYLC